jgi:hypothetical protein
MGSAEEAIRLGVHVSGAQAKLKTSGENSDHAHILEGNHGNGVDRH